jgi:hypothetical protein
MPSRPSALFAKLNLTDQREIAVWNAPPSFDGELDRLGETTVRERLRADQPVGFALGFATRKAEVDAFARDVAKATEGDAVVWVAYPKGSSRRYTCDFNRDTGWDVFGRLGFEPVRQVAIDDDWSALRFRRAEFIKSVKRAPERALSAEGRQKASSRMRGRR